MSKLLVLGTADWSQPIATNQHYVVRELAREFDLVYVESMGLRTPELTVRDIRRMAKRLGIGAKIAENNRRPVPGSVDVRSPKVLPRHAGFAKRINGPRVHRLVADWIEQPGPRLLWTYTPVTYGLEALATSVVYHCVDLLGEVQGISRQLIHGCEKSLSRRADVALGTSPVVEAHLAEIGFRSIESWPNVADTEVIRQTRPQHVERHPKRLVFAGNLSTTKVDFPLLERLLIEGFDLHLAGPIAEGGGSAAREVEALVTQGATYHGMLTPHALAKLYWTAEVGLVPYVINGYTRGVNPLKTYEYLAAGLGVASTPVPAVDPVERHVAVAGDPDSFIRAIARVHVSESADESLRDERTIIADEHSWSVRGQRARDLAASLLNT